PRPQNLLHTPPIFPGYGRRCSDRCPARRSGGWRSRSALGCADGAFGHGATVPCWGLRSAFREKPDAPRRFPSHFFTTLRGESHLGAPLVSTMAFPPQSYRTVRYVLIDTCL